MIREADLNRLHTIPACGECRNRATASAIKRAAKCNECLALIVHYLTLYRPAQRLPPVEEMRNLPRIVAETVIGKEVDVVVWRGDKEITMKVEVGELPETVPQLAAVDPSESPAEPEEEVLGMTLSPLTADMREQFSLSDDVSGVLVTGVSGDGVAAERGLRPGDIILEVAQVKVSTPSELVNKVRAAEQSGRKSVLLLVQRGGDLRFVAMRLDG